MARALHLLRGEHADLVAATIARQHAAGDEVAVALLHGARAPALPEGVRVHRVPGDLSYAALLDLIHAADHVVTW